MTVFWANGHSDSHRAGITLVWPSMTASWKKVRVSQILHVLSAEALARRLPSGENLTEQTPFSCPALCKPH